MATVTHPDPSPPLSVADDPGTRAVGVDPIVPPEGDARYEVVDGEVVELGPMGTIESEFAFLVALEISQFARARGIGSVYIELLFRLDPGRKQRRRPDVAFVSASKWPVGKRVPGGEFWDMVPDLVIEVVSPTDRAGELNRKVAEYFRSEVATVWVVYGETQQVYVYTSPTDVRILTPPDELDGGDVLPGFRIALERLFNDDPDVAATDRE